jgi:catechol 2,3-dioxygenase-like lactoylglutathione lyase family enzyme
MWIEGIDHVQMTSSPEVEKEMLFFYGKVLQLKEIAKPELLQANRGAWYLLGDVQLHLSLEQNSSNETSRRHICFRVANLNAFEQHLIAHGIEIIPDRQPIPGYNRFYLRDPGGNRIEIVELTPSV